MKNIRWGTKRWNFKLAHYDESQEAFYWPTCALYFFSTKSNNRLGSIKFTKLALTISKEYCDRAWAYIKKEKLKLKWEEEYNKLIKIYAQLEDLSSQLVAIEIQFDLKALTVLQNKALDLK